jgi:NADH:ubiquinone oxidoreductase subunit 5 (subunit L)/multisubunit Na+/H+ antiporter MnhA subunit
VEIWAAMAVGWPLLAAVLLVTALRHACARVARQVVLVAIGLTVACVLALLRQGNSSVSMISEWLPGTGPLGLAASTSGLSVALVTAVAAGLVIPIAAWNPEQRPNRSQALMLAAMSAANAGLLADHFLGRYAALEVVALCAGLVPLATLQGKPARTLAWQIYLPLRIGDLAMLVAMLILGIAAGTLHVGQALEAAPDLGRAHLTWVLVGLTLAAWAKLGGWPFSVWGLAARRLSLGSQAWLYATLVPNLGAYLLYRIAPLLASAGSISTALAWLGAGGAALGALAAIIQRDMRTALVSVAASQAGLLLCAAAAGLQPLVLLAILALTPLRLLLYLAADAAQHATSSRWRRMGAGVFGLGGVALSAFGLLTTWWLRRASVQNVGLPLAATVLTECAVSLGIVWAASATRALAVESSLERSADREPERTGWRRWTPAGVLSVAVLAGGLAFGPLSGRIATACQWALPPLPSVADLLHYTISTPALLASTLVGFGAWLLLLRFGGQQRMQPTESMLRSLSTENILSTVARAVTKGTRAGLAFEHQGLDVLVRWTAQAVTASARAAHHWMEQEGLEGLLHAAAQAVLRASQALSRQHTGLLRRNIVWMAIALALAAVCLTLWRW